MQLCSSEVLENASSVLPWRQKECLDAGQADLIEVTIKTSCIMCKGVLILDVLVQ